MCGLRNSEILAGERLICLLCGESLIMGEDGKLHCCCSGGGWDEHD
jgi:hypothetical protein